MSNHDPQSWVFFNGDIKRYNEVSLGLMTHGLHYGTGCYEGIRGYYNGGQLYLVHLAKHFDRMHDSAHILGFNLPYETNSLVETTIDLVRRNDYRTDCYVRPILFKSGEGIGQGVKVSESFGIYTTKFGKYLDTGNGIRCKVSTWRRVPDLAFPVRAKVTGAYVNSHLASAEAKALGYDEAICMDESGHISEGPAENLFMKRHGHWVTSPVSSDILEGITRASLFDLISEAGLSVVQRPIDRSELYACEELFLCGTGAEVCPVIEVDGRVVGTGKPGESTLAIQDSYFNAVRGEDPSRADWLTEIY